MSAGWDPRPRHDYPCPWGGAGSPSYIVDPTMAELEAHTGPSHTRFAVAMSAKPQPNTAVVLGQRTGSSGSGATATPRRLTR